jgi:hypothetical protein
MKETEFKNQDFITVGKLLDFIEKYKIPRDAHILTHRIHDGYFDGWDLPDGTKSTPWEVFKKKGISYLEAQKFNEALAAGELKHARIPLRPITEEELESLMDEYIPIFTAIEFNEEDKNLYLTAHY